MKAGTEPFWETAYRTPNGPSPFGVPSAEVVALFPALDRDSRVLDLGCGDGRHAIPLAVHGCHVTAVDVSAAAITALCRRAQEAEVYISAIVQDVDAYAFAEPFDLVIAHGLLHLLPIPVRDRLLSAMRAHTAPGGHNVVTVFTDTLPPPPDLAAEFRGLFREGELFTRYHDWEPVLAMSYVLSDEHPGGIRHEHPVNKLVARRPQ